MSDRLLELLAERATEGLGDGAEHELEALLREEPETDAEALDRAAAALDLSLVRWVDEPLPAELRGRIESEARAFLREGRRPAPLPERAAPPRRRRRGLSTWLAASGWAAAAAALLLWMAGATPPWVDAPEVLPERAAGPAELRAALLAEAPDALRVAWSATDDPAARGAAGDVVWSDERQEGYMRFQGLAANDPQVEQYQLWIFDVAQDERYPVDGGVFDVGPDGETVVPIRAALQIVEPTLFAITVEKPGGVVVSDRERLPLLASVERG